MLRRIVRKGRPFKIQDYSTDDLSGFKALFCYFLLGLFDSLAELTQVKIRFEQIRTAAMKFLAVSSSLERSTGVSGGAVRGEVFLQERGHIHAGTSRSRNSRS